MSIAKGSVELSERGTQAIPSSPSGELGLWQSIKKYPRVVGYCMALTSAILLYGYDLVIVGNVSSMPQFQQEFGERYGSRYIIGATWLALWNASSPLGVMVGAAAGGIFQDRLGRRRSLALGSFLSAVAVAICFVSHLPAGANARRGVFLAGKLFQGLSIGMILCTTQTYMSEILPTSLRGPVMALFPVFTLLGQLVGALIVYALLGREGSAAYTIAIATQWPFSAVPFLVAILIPESPTYYIHENKTDMALASLKRLHTTNFDIVAELEQLQRSIQREQQDTERSEPTYADCFKGSNLRRTLIVGYSQLLPQVFGLTLLAGASYFVQIVGMAASTSIIILILGIVLGLLSNVASTWVISAVGRRTLVISTLGITAVLWLGMGISGFFTGTVVVWYTAITMMLVIIVCGLGVWPCSYAIGAETSSLHLRAKTQGLGWLVGGLSTGVFGILLPYIYNPDQGDLRGKTGFIFAGLCAITCAFTWWYLPEMKGRTNAEIEEMFELRLPARQFKHWSSGSSAGGRED